MVCSNPNFQFGYSKLSKKKCNQLSIVFSFQIEDLLGEWDWDNSNSEVNKLF